MTTPDFTLGVADESGVVRATLYDERPPVRSVVGVAMMSWSTYRSLAKSVLIQIGEVALASVTSSLGDLLWRDAVALEDGNAERGKERLLAAGWTQIKVEQMARAIVSSVMDEIAKKFPVMR